MEFFVSLDSSKEIYHMKRILFYYFLPENNTFLQELLNKEIW